MPVKFAFVAIRLAGEKNKKRELQRSRFYLSSILLQFKKIKMYIHTIKFYKFGLRNNQLT